MNLIDFLTNETIEDLKEAVEEDRIYFLDDKGFFTWYPLEKNGKVNIYLSNGFILKEQRTKYNLYKVRKFFQDKFKNLGLIYWQRKKDFFYTQGGHK